MRADVEKIVLALNCTNEEANALFLAAGYAPLPELTATLLADTYRKILATLKEPILDKP